MQTDENGLIYMRARYYSPEVCRFVSQDSVIGSISSSQSLNRFAFCGGNPINYVDVDGNEAIAITAGGVALIAAGVSVVATAVSQIDYAGAYRSLKQAGTKIKNAASDIAETVKEGLEWTSDAIKNLVREASNTLLSESQNADKEKDSGTAKVSKSIVQNSDDSLNFSKRALDHMNESGRYVPTQILQEAIKHGKATLDPRGSKAIMYTIEMFKNGKSYTLEVLYDAATKTIWHFMYR